MAALTKKARVRATPESMVLNLMAARMDGSSRWSLRDLDEGGMEVEIMRHDGGADHADGDDEHALVGQVGADECVPFPGNPGGSGGAQRFRCHNTRRWWRQKRPPRLRSVRMPMPWSASSSSTSKAVMIKAQNTGMPKSRWRATALPRDSARSVAPMAISIASQLGQRVQRGIPVAAALGQILAGDHAEARGNDLQEDRHQAGQRRRPTGVHI